MVGGELLPVLLAEGRDVRTLVRDPRKLGEHRVDVQTLLGDIGDPFAPPPRDATRGHGDPPGGALIRDQPGGTIEELNGLAAVRLLRAAERAESAALPLFFGNGGDRVPADPLLPRSKALAERAVEESPPRDHGLRAVDHLPPGSTPLDHAAPALQLKLCPPCRSPGSGHALYQPIWARDVARCVAGSSTGAGRTPASGGRYALTLAPEAPLL